MLGKWELMRMWCGNVLQIVDFVCSETYPVKSNNLFEFLATLIGRIVQSDRSTEDFPMLVAKHLSTLHKATNRLCLHLLNRLQVDAPQSVTHECAALA